MAIRRSLIAFVAAAGCLVAGAGTAFAAFYFVTLSTSSGPVGTEVAIRIDASGNVGGSSSSELFLIRRNVFDERQRCNDLPGAVVVGEVTWREGTVEFQDQSYPGFVGEGSFTVPEVPLATYIIAENVSFVGNLCFRYDSFVVSTSLPDGAMATPPSPITLVGLALFSLALLVSRARRVSERPPAT